MKLDKGLKIVLIILLIILVSMISFFGIFIQEKSSMENILADYQLGMDLEGYRVVAISVDESTETIYYDKDGNEVEEEAKDGSKEEVAVNAAEDLTKENYIQTKKIVEKRLNELGVVEYIIRQDENTGKMIVQLPEDGLTDLALQYIYITGKFVMEDDENGDVLLDNSNIKSARAGYNTDTNGTTVYLNMEFNKDSVEKLKEISSTYKTSTDEEGNDNSKTVSIKLDDTTLISTSFSKELNAGILSLSLGTSTSSTEINSYLQEASNIAIILNNGNFPITYTIEQNRYMKSDITDRDIMIVVLIVAIVMVVALIVLIVMYRKNGILVAISNIGYIAVVLLVLRYTNVIITTEGLFGILIGIILNYVFSIYLLKTLKTTANEHIEISKAYNKTVLAMILVLVPAIAVGITLCFASWMPMYSFGAIIFWAILLIFIYNTVVTRTLLLLSSKNK